jgi:CubicO group peptidase (beta-lactamase class C family)
MFKKIFLVVIKLFSVYVAVAQVGYDAKRLNRIDDFINSYINANKLNGATGIVLQNGKIIYHKAFGYADVEVKKRMEHNSIFRIASMTKPVVSTAVMMLFEEGKFLLDDPVSKFIPEFKNAVVLDKFNETDTTYTTVPAKSEVTIRNLLTHTSGLGYAQIGSKVANAIYFKHGINGGIGSPYNSLKTVIPKLAKLPLFHHPGDNFTYGLNVDVLGYLVEVISGMPLDKFLQQRLFAPLGMKDTYFYLPQEKYNRLVSLYTQTETGIALQKDSIALNGLFVRDFPKTNGTFFSAGAGLASTAYDYALFAQMMLNGGTYNGVRILGPHTINMMTQNQLANYKFWNDSSGVNPFGLGFGVSTKKNEMNVATAAGTFDWAGMFASHFWIDPKNKIVGVFMRNIWPSREWDFGSRIKPVVYQALTQ